MAICIVYSHAPSGAPGDPAHIAESYLTGLRLGVVPVYFFFSAWLLFSRPERLTPSGYLDTLRRKSFSLLLPYLLWITLGYVLNYFFAHDSLPANPRELYRIYVADVPVLFPQHSLLGYDYYVPGIPIGLRPMWFIRDLIIMTLFSPLVYGFARLTGRWGIPIILLMILLHVGLPFLGFMTVQYYTLGAVCALRGFDFVSFCRRWMWPAAVVALVLSLITGWQIYTLTAKEFWASSTVAFVRDMSILSSGIMIIGIAARCLDKSWADRLIDLGAAGVFVYFTHNLVIFWRFQDITNWICPGTYWDGLFSHNATTLLLTAFLTAVYFFLRRYTPRLLSIITGGRVRQRLLANPEKLANFAESKL